MASVESKSIVFIGKKKNFSECVQASREGLADPDGLPSFSFNPQPDRTKWQSKPNQQKAPFVSVSPQGVGSNKSAAVFDWVSVEEIFSAASTSWPVQLHLLLSPSLPSSPTTQ